MAGRDHDATVEVVHTSDVRHRRGCRDVQQVSVCAGGGQASDQTVLEHIRTTAGILTNDDACRVIITVVLTQSVIIPAQKTTNLVGMVGGQSDSSLTTEAIGSKIFPHYSFFLIQRVNRRIDICF